MRPPVVNLVSTHCAFITRPSTVGLHNNALLVVPMSKGESALQPRPQSVSTRRYLSTTCLVNSIDKKRSTSSSIFHHNLPLFSSARALTTTRLSSFPSASSKAPSTPTRALPLTGDIRNSDIPFRSVHLVDPSTNTLSPLTPLSQILSSISLSTHAVKLVSSTPHPIVRIIDLEEEKRKEREHDAKLRLNRKIAVEDKEVQVSWLAAIGDLGHKISTAKSILEKGDRVQVICASRGGGGEVSEKRRAEVIGMFEEALGEVGTKWKDDQRNEGSGMVILHYQPKADIVASAKKKVLEGELEKRRIKDEKKEARRKKEEERARKAKERVAGAGS